MHRAPSDDYRLIEPLTGMRAFAALWVFARHFFAAGHYDCGFGTKVALGPAIRVVILGGWGVDLFFVISGFVILHVYGDRLGAGMRAVDAAGFYVLRWGRMYPLHFAILAMMAVGYAAERLPWDGRGFEFTGLLVNLLMLQSWGFYDVIVWNRPSWSISLEWFVYLLFPLFVVLFGRIRRARSLLLSIAVLCVVYYLARYGIWQFERANIGPAALMRVTFGFLMGFFLYGLYRRRFLPNLSWDAVCLATVAGFTAMMLMNGTVAKFEYSLNFPIALLVLSAANSTGVAARLFDNRVSLYLGEISYSIYMVHFPLLRFLTYNFGDDIAGFAAGAPQWQLWVMASCVLAALIGVSALCYHTIEVPCRDYVKRRVRAREARSAA